jgi:ubiquitin-like domain-containing CTD phosphatase 1
MFSVYSEREGKPFKHEVKALEIIWRKFPLFYNQANTVHVDDLSRNFAMNPQSGIKVHAYRDSKNRGASDKELKYVKRSASESLILENKAQLTTNESGTCSN